MSQALTKQAALPQALLPSGFMDRLPPLAAQELELTQRLLKHFTGFGYNPVTPPLAEYSETMLAGLSDEAAKRYLQVMDPLSGNMLALRADMTGQISRIAATTLKDAARPLRLCYAGPRISAIPAALQAQRQSLQIGLEYIGEADFYAVAELLAVSCHSLSAYSLGELTIDISYPPLLNALIGSFPEDKRAEIRDAVANKNVQALRAHGATIPAALLEAAGSIADVTSALHALGDDVMQVIAAKLTELGAALDEKNIDANIHVDLLEHTDTEYYNGFAFALFCSKPGMELGRGGMYRIGEEDSVGFTFYMDDVLAHLPAPKEKPLVALPAELSCEEAELIQKQGYRTVFVRDMDAASLDAMGVGYVWRSGKITIVTTE